MTKDEIISGLKGGRKLRCDRKDEPLLPWLLDHPNIKNRFVQADDQYSYIEFWWDAERQKFPQDVEKDVEKENIISNPR